MYNLQIYNLLMPFLFLGTNTMIYTNLRKGRHTITVRATCPGNGDSGFKVFKFRVRRRPTA